MIEIYQIQISDYLETVTDVLNTVSRDCSVLIRETFKQFDNLLASKTSFPTLDRIFAPCIKFGSANSKDIGNFWVMLVAPWKTAIQYGYIN